MVIDRQAGKGKTVLPNVHDPFGEIAAIQTEWIIADELDIKIQSDKVLRPGHCMDIGPGDFVQAEVRVDIQITSSREGERTAKLRFFMTRVVRLCEKKDIPRETVSYVLEYWLHKRLIHLITLVTDRRRLYNQRCRTCTRSVMIEAAGRARDKLSDHEWC